MTWLLFELDRHPDVLERLRDEARTVLAGKEITTQRLAAMRYLDAVIQEIGRLHHPAPALPRKVVRSFEFNGYYVPAGSLVLYSPAASHRLPEIFDNPEVFEPSRYLPPREEHKREPLRPGHLRRSTPNLPGRVLWPYGDEAPDRRGCPGLSLVRDASPGPPAQTSANETTQGSGLRLRFRLLSDSVADLAT